MRVALYWSPSADDPLAALGNAWLGRDPATNISIPQPPIPNIEALTEAPRHYGFHCTLRPPMRIATSWNEFRAAACRIAAATAAFALPPLQLTLIDGFLALTLSRLCPEMQSLADLCVRETNPHRAPPTPDELARRRAANLSPRQENLLQAWGYPYVMQEWRFHLTLTRRLAPAEQASLTEHAARHFAAALAIPRNVDQICIYTNPEGDFRIAGHLRLRRK